VPRLQDVRLGDLGRGVARLGPFIGAAGAALLLVTVPPNGRGARQATSAGAKTRFQLPSPPGAPDAGRAAPAAADASQSGLVASGSPSALAPPAIAGPAPSLSAPSSSGASAAADTPAAVAPASPSADATPVTPLTVAAKAWASREAGTPLASTGVPDGALPVGNRIGQADKASFVRLGGTATTLTLSTDPAGDRNLAGPGAVQACVITASWTAADAMAFDQAPAYDAAKCVAGTQPDSSTWSFDLGAFAERAGGNGFALVAAPGAPVDFQVTFKVR
jgi:hypothetical protein